MKRNNKGITLVELIIGLALFSLVIVTSMNFIVPALGLPNKTVDEYSIQHKMRLLSKKITDVVRDASACFALYRTNDQSLTEGWTYVMVSMDKTSVIEYQWDSTSDTHVPVIIAEPQDGVTYALEFSKLLSSYDDNLLEYKIIANVNGSDREVLSEAEALNVLQVIDKGSTVNPSNTLAYRSDPRPSQVSSSKAAISLVLDVSGSMGSNYMGTGEDRDKRINLLKAETTKLITSLSGSPNIYATIVPFATNANGTYVMAKAQVNEGSPNVLQDTVDGLTADGYTNTGDGIRRGYWSINQFNFTQSEENPDWEIQNFMIILVDGQTNYYSHLSWFDHTYYTGDTNISWWRTSSSESRGDGYVNLMGSIVQDFGTGALAATYSTGDTSEMEEIQTYVIGFSDKASELSDLQFLATAVGAEPTLDDPTKNYYTADGAAALENVFASIKKQIDASLWHIGGPN